MEAGQHSITYGNKNTWTDWHIVPTSAPEFAVPPFKTEYVEIPGSSVTLDLSTALTGFPTFQQRTGSHEFLIYPDTNDPFVLHSEIMNYIHGRKMDAFLKDDPMFKYNGRFVVENIKIDSSYSYITIGYNVDPFKYHLNDAMTENPDIFKTYDISGVQAITLFDNIADYLDYMPVCPEIIIDSPDGSVMEVEFVNEELSIHAYLTFLTGRRKSHQIILSNMSGTNKMYFKVKGTGTFAINFTNGRL